MAANQYLSMGLTGLRGAYETKEVVTNERNSRVRVGVNTAELLCTYSMYVFRVASLTLDILYSCSMKSTYVFSGRFRLLAVHLHPTTRQRGLLPVRSGTRVPYTAHWCSPRYGSQRASHRSDIPTKSLSCHSRFRSLRSMYMRLLRKTTSPPAVTAGVRRMR